METQACGYIQAQQLCFLFIRVEIRKYLELASALSTIEIWICLAKVVHPFSTIHSNLIVHLLPVEAENHNMAWFEVFRYDQRELCFGTGYCQKLICSIV